MKPWMLFCALIFVRPFYSESFNPSNAWLLYVSKSLSYNLQLGHNSNFVHSLHNNAKTYWRIKRICHQQSFPYCHGRLKGLCGSVEIITDGLMDCLGEFTSP